MQIHPDSLPAKQIQQWYKIRRGKTNTKDLSRGIRKCGSSNPFEGGKGHRKRTTNSHEKRIYQISQARKIKIDMRCKIMVALLMINE